MATRVSVHSATNPRPGTAAVRVTKVQLTNDRGDRVAEARWLAEVDHSGIVRLQETTEDPFTIVTDHAGGTTLRTADVGPPEAAEILAQVADTLADLHDAGRAHGKLSLDHIILGSERPVLCSPDGNIDDPRADLQGLAWCVRDLGRKWGPSKHDGEPPEPWATLATRLASDPSMSARRAAQQFRRLASPEPAAPTQEDKGSWRGLLTVASIVAIAIGGLLLVPRPEPSEAADGARVTIDGQYFEVGQAGDEVVVLDHPCDAEGRVLVLSGSTVWRYGSVGNGVEAEVYATIPGATSLSVVEIMVAEDRDPDRPCEAAQAVGPAGASLLETWLPALESSES